ncbi:diguanylate cyclase [Desulfonema magnum]|nr:diguanylate cyclase [Desulfonema magnum]
MSNENQKFKILIVDDAPINMQFAACILEREGYHLMFAWDGETALDLVKSDRFDLILLDIIMPGINGFEVCRRLKKNDATRDIPILFLTSMTETESLVKGFEIGAMDYVTKPFNEAELVARVKTHLELNRSKQELKKTNEKLIREIAERRQAETQYRNMYENAVQGMFQSTLSGKILSANPSYVRIMGCSLPEEILTNEDISKEFYYNPEDREKMIASLKKKKILTNYELRIRRKDGTPAWLLLNVRLATDDKGEPFMEGIVTDNTARKLAEEELRHSEMTFRYLAVHDNLTGLYNTRYLYQVLPELIRTSVSDNTPLSLIFMDIDNFKHTVDTYGHLNGSQALQEVAETIRETLTEPAYGVAYGGDEFVVVLPGFDKKQAIEKAEEIRARMRETVYLSNRGHHVKLRASCGVSAYPDDADDMTRLLRLADKAMFNIKKKGKDAVCGCEEVV